MNNLTTKFGDGGWTKNVDGTVISKGSKPILAMAYGDWLNVLIGRVHKSFPILLPEKSNIILQKAYSILMAQISARSSLVYTLDPEALMEVDRISAEIREELLDFRMNDWLIYEGNDAQECSKLSRVFESMYVEVMANQPPARSGENVLEYQFINRVSDMFFYMGLLIQISKPCLSSQ